MAKKSDMGHLVAILSYLTLFGWLVALIIHLTQTKTKLGSYHLRQSLGLALSSMVIALILVTGMVVIPIIGFIISAILLVILKIAVFIFWIMGLVYAIQAKQTPIPIIGEKAQEWFSGL